MDRILQRLFFLFGVVVGGSWFLLSSAAGIVWLLLAPGNRQTLYFYGRIFCRGLTRMMGWKIEVDGREELERHRPCVMVANHQSFLDVVTFGSIFPRRTVSAGKREIGRIPVFGLFYRLSGNLIIDRGHARSAHDSLEAAAHTMREDMIAVWFMPEGHRNRQRELLPFKSGAFRLAIAARVPIVPIIAGPLTEIVDTKRWSARRGRLPIRVLPPVSTDGLEIKDLSPLIASVRSQMQRAFDELRESSAAASESNGAAR
jgi:1-acyl-sn-glycerol-3-phosphate acyltransferase